MTTAALLPLSRPDPSPRMVLLAVFGAKQREQNKAEHVTGHLRAGIVSPTRLDPVRALQLVTRLA